MSLNSTNCALLLLKEYFGDIVSNVGKCLTINGSQTIAYIRKQTKLPVNKISESLRVLIQHNMVKFSLHKRGYVEYALDLEAVLALTRYPKYISCAKKLDMDAAEFFIQVVLLNGQITMSDVIQRVISRLKEDLTDLSKIPYQSIVKTFERLVQIHFLQRCPEVVGPKSGAPEPAVPDMDVSTESMYQVPVINDQLLAVQMQEVKTEAEPDEPARKKIRTEGPAKQTDTAIYWRVNFDRIHQYMRDQLIVSAIENQMGKEAAEVARYLCYAAETVTDDWAVWSNLVSHHTIAQEMKKSGKEMNELVLKQYLTLLSGSANGFISKEQDSQGGMYIINFKKAIIELTWTTIESVVQERFGSKCLRIFRLIRSKKYVELQEIERLAMINAKEAKESTYKLFSQNFIQTAEISQTADHAPSKSFYLFHIELSQLVQTILEWCYKTISNLIRRQEMEKNTSKRLLEKQRRVDAILLSLQQGGADEAQWKDVEEMVTPLERAQIEKFKHRCSKLELGQVELESTVFVLQLYLNYMNKRI